MRALIVGCGYVGLPLAADLVRQGHTVYGLRRQLAAAEELQAVGIRPIRADITDPDQLRQIPGPFHWVVNCVATPFGGDQDAYHRTYWEGTRNLLAWLKDQPVERYVYTSSTGVYGQDDGSWVDETSPTTPEAPTARVLASTEQELLSAHQERGFPVTILRLAGIYGPNRGYWLRRFLQSEARIPGDGTRWMNMVHRDDIVSTIQAVLDKGSAGQVINVCDNEPVTYLDFFRWLAGRLGRTVPPFDAEEPGARRKRGSTNKRVSNEKLRNSLGCSLKYPTYREGYTALLELGGSEPS